MQAQIFRASRPNRLNYTKLIHHLSVFTGFTVGFRSLSGADTTTWMLMILLGVTMIGFAYPAWFACLKKLPASRVSIFIYLTPVFAVVLAFLILDERFSWLFYAGGGLVLGSVVVSTLSRAETEPARHH